MPRGFPNHGRYSYGATFYCSPCNMNIAAIRVNEYCRINFVSRKQVKRMLRDRELLGIKHKNIMYVVKNPNYD